MKRAMYIFVVVCFFSACKEPPKETVDLPVSETTEGTSGPGDPGAAVVEAQDKEPLGKPDTLLPARKVRRAETRKFGSMTQDAVTLVDACLVEEDLKVASIVGILRAAYESPERFQQVAAAAAEAALQGTQPAPGCSRREAVYWARDQDGAGDFAFRVPVAAGEIASLWWVPDEGDARPAKPNEMKTRVIVDRLLKVATTKLEVDGELEAAITLITAAQRVDPSNKRAAEVRAELMQELDPVIAAQDLRRFMRAHGESRDLLATLAGLLMGSKKASETDEAQDLLARVLQEEPNHVKALTLLAEIYGDAGDYERAVQYYEQVLKAHPETWLAHYGAAVAQIELNHLPEAVTHLNGFLKQEPEDEDALYLRATTYLLLGQKKKALADAQVLRKLAPEAPELPRLFDALR